MYPSIYYSLTLNQFHFTFDIALWKYFPIYLTGVPPRKYGITVDFYQ